MASIRRTQSAAGDIADLSLHSHAVSHSSTNSGRHHSSPPPPASSFLSFVRPSPQPQPQPQRFKPWKRLLLRLLLFFFFGFLFGLYPFVELEDAPLRTPLSPVNGSNHLPRRREIEIARSDDKGDGKLLIVVTPTYNRATQGYYLSRLAQTLRLVPPPLVWIVVEMGAASVETAEILMGTGVMYRHLVCKSNLTNIKDRGVHQRNTALRHIQRHRLDGIVYFADDDNIYSLDLFERLREIRRFGVWPVAMLSQGKNKATLEGPVCIGSQVVGWHTNEKSKRVRRFHVDMSGFAFNSTILWDPRRWNRPNYDAIRQLDTVKEGFQETTFIEQIVEDESQMEGLTNDCSRIMNWHLHLDAKDLFYPRGWQVSSNLDAIIRL